MTDEPIVECKDLANKIANAAVPYLITDKGKQALYPMAGIHVDGFAENIAAHLEPLYTKIKSLEDQLPKVGEWFRWYISEKELQTLKEWMDKKDLTKYSGCSGGRFTYQFTSTSLGGVIEVIDNLDKDKINITDYSMW